MCYNAIQKGALYMDYKKAIIELISKIHNEKYLKRIYKLTMYLYVRGD